jgi:hypothetical protein
VLAQRYADSDFREPQVSVDFFTVPTIRFQVLYVFLILAHDRRRILHVSYGISLRSGAGARRNAFRRASSAIR